MGLLLSLLFAVFWLATGGASFSARCSSFGFLSLGLVIIVGVVVVRVLVVIGVLHA